MACQYEAKMPARATTCNSLPTQTYFVSGTLALAGLFPCLRIAIFAQRSRALLQRALVLGSRLCKRLDVLQDGRIAAAVHRRDHSL
jgi:hypothetical protein